MSRPRSVGHPWRLVAPAVFVMAWGGNHFTPLLHLYEQVGHYQPWQANLLLGTYVLGLVPGLLVAAAISDRHGRRRVLLGGLVVSVVGNLVLAVSLQSFPLLCLGRALAGAGVGVAMAVGTSWIKELSSPPFDAGATPSAGARRPALTLTLGFGLGAGVTGALAQWAPMPTRLPFLLHVVLGLVALGWLMRAPETLVGSASTPAEGPWWHDLRVPAAGHRLFTSVIVPVAPWIFAAAGVAYAIVPAVEAPSLGEWSTLYATVLTVATLGAGAAVQGVVGTIERITGGRALLVGMALMTTGMVTAVIAALEANPVLGLVVAVLLGVAYGITVVAGLMVVQRIASPTELAGLTGVYYAIAYAGFLLPAVLAGLLPVAGYQWSLLVVAVACGSCWGTAARNLRRRNSVGLRDGRHVELRHPHRGHLGEREPVVPLPAQHLLGSSDLSDALQ